MNVLFSKDSAFALFVSAGVAEVVSRTPIASFAISGFIAAAECLNNIACAISSFDLALLGAFGGQEASGASTTQRVGAGVSRDGRTFTNAYGKRYPLLVGSDPVQEQW